MDATRTTPLLSVNNISLSYGAVPVLRDCSFTVRDLIRPGCITGQVVGILGRSGCGKTSLLKIIAGLLQPTSGTVLIDVDQHPTHAGDVGIVSQQYTVYRNRDVLSNLTVAAQQAANRPTPVAAKQRAVDMLNSFGLLEQAHNYPCQLSGGQRQRVAIMQQMLTGTSFLAFDEPTAGLDPLAKATTCSLISQLANRSETETVLLVSHDIPSVVAMCDTVLVMGREPGAGGGGSGSSGAKIITEIDLISRGLMWHDQVRRLPAFTETVEELQDMFTRL